MHGTDDTHDAGARRNLLHTSDLSLVSSSHHTRNNTVHTQDMKAATAVTGN